MTENIEPIPTEIILHKKSRTLEVLFSTGERFIFTCEFLRQYSPSADARGKEITGKENISILAIEPVGQYAIKPIFSDGHSTGIFSWKTLYELGRAQGLNFESLVGVGLKAGLRKKTKFQSEDDPWKS